jgi:hypothetical protein
MTLLSRLLLLTSFSCLSIISGPASGSTIEISDVNPFSETLAPATVHHKVRTLKPIPLMANSSHASVWLQAQTPSPAASASPQASPVQPSPTNSAPVPSTSNLPGWLLGIITFFVVAGGISIFLLQKNFSQSIDTEEESTNHISNHPTSKQAKRNPSRQVSTSAKRSHHRNGYAPPALASANGTGGESNATANSGDEVVPVGETTRLSKISIVDELAKELRSPDPTKRQKAIWELGQRGDTRAVQPLVDLMLDSDSRQRSLILAALSEIGTRTLKPLSRALAISLQDDNPEVRKNAIRDLTRVYDLVAQISQLLSHATEDPDGEVRETAHWALSQLNRIRGAGNSVPMLQDVVSPPENLSGETRR